MAIKIVCAWCKKDMGEKEDESNETSHSICPDCHKKVLEEEDLVEEV